jgi:hypothetical protein
VKLPLEALMEEYRTGWSDDSATPQATEVVNSRTIELASALIPLVRTTEQEDPIEQDT